MAAFELDLDAVAPHATLAPLYQEVTSFPEVHEDIAVIVSDRVASADVLAVVRRSGAPLLARAEVFDVYRDAERIGEGNVSLALRLAYHAADRTLTDEEVADQRKTIAAALDERLDARLRGV